MISTSHFNYIQQELQVQQDSINNCQNSSIQAQQAAAQRYKTELCRSFQENGTCKYGEKCQFAHGYHELRSMMRHPKYKSELCRTFHAQGYCPYGPRCHFVHEIQPETINKPNPTRNWINVNTTTNIKPASPWDSKPISPKNPGLLMCALSSSNSSLFSDFSDWSKNRGSTGSISSSGSSIGYELSPTSSRSLSPDSDRFCHQDIYDDVADLSTTMLVNQILNTINDNKSFW